LSLPGQTTNRKRGPQEQLEETHMDAALVFEKTGSGREAIQTGTPQLDFKSRAVLIMVDGVTSALALNDKILKARLSDQGLTLLEHLFHAGLIAPKSGTVTAKPTVAPIPVEAPATAASAPKVPSVTLAQDLIQARRAGVKSIEKVLGAGGERLALALEDARDIKSFVAAAERIANILRQSHGEAVAAQFVANVVGPAKT
jgi:hypothetical protein